jgi:cell division septation protein DedD
MRGEIGNRVTWLPRLNRDRQQVCGYEPSYPAGALPVDTAEPEPVVEPMVETAAGTGAAEPAVAPAPKIAPTSNTRHKTPVERAAALTCPCFVQVGAFAVFSNADRVAERLLDMGFRVTIVRERLGRRPIRTVLAGPFDEAAAYIDAFNRVRDAGFADAFRRRQPVHMP